jgi:hydrogenase maturation factor
MARAPVVPGEPAADLPQPDPIAALTAQVNAQQELINQLLQRGATPGAPEVVLPTQEEAIAQARQTGRFVLSRDGYIGPPVIKPSQVAAPAR